MFKNFLRLWPHRCKSCFNQQTSSYAKRINDERSEYLSQILDIPKLSADYLCLKYPMLSKLKRPDLNSVIDTVTGLGLKREILVEEPLIFSIQPMTIQNRYQVLQECGLHTITGYHLSNFLNVVRRRTIADLKKDGILLDVNIENRLAACLTQWPTSLTTLIQCDTNQLTLHNLRLKIIKSYLELTLDLSQEEFDRGLSTYPTIQHRPLQMIRETLTLLLDTINMPIHRIKTNLYLIHANSDNLKNSIYNVKNIAGVDIKDILRMYPKLCLRKADNIVEIKKIFKEYAISNEAQLKCLNIYTLGPETIRERLDKAMETPEFQVYITHPRFLKIIMYNKNAVKRVLHLYKTNKKCLSLNSLSGCDDDFRKFVKAPGDRSGKGKDLLYCIAHQLGKAYSVMELRRQLKRHPFWINVPLVHIRLIFQKLLVNFSQNDIYENCAILLYPLDDVMDTLNIVSSHDNKELPGSFLDHIDTTKLTKSQILSLVLYILEKDHYFSGNGVWTDENLINNSEHNRISESV